MQKIRTFLWFHGDAEEAMELYTSLFDDSEIVDVTRHGSDGPGPEGPVFVATFKLAGQEFMALNGGPQFQFTEAMSLFVNCETQEEIDRLWERLLEGGEEQMCGWLKDRFGVSWQIVPRQLVEMMEDPNPDKARAVTEAMLKMGKLEVQELQRAYDAA